MTKQHMIAAANMVHVMPATNKAEKLARVAVQEAFEQLFAKFNYNFDIERFRAACDK
jgi:hypothetical protein